MTLQEMLTEILALAGTDPRFKGLVEALTEECSFTGEPWELYHDDLYEHVCPRCWRTTHDHPISTLRTDWPQGALAGTLYDWSIKVYADRLIRTPEIEHLHRVLLYCFGRLDCNERASRLFLKFIEKEASHARLC